MYFGSWEVERSVRASELQLGPRVVYVDKTRNIMIEEALPDTLHKKGPGLTEQEKIVLGRRFAEQMFIMLSPGNVARAGET